MIKRFAMAAGLLLMLGLPLLAGDVAAAPPGANDAAERCREGGLPEQLGITRGECVNLVKLLPSESANSELAGLCSIASFQAIAGATNKGQCIKVLKPFF